MSDWDAREIKNLGNRAATQLDRAAGYRGDDRVQAQLDVVDAAFQRLQAIVDLVIVDRDLERYEGDMRRMQQTRGEILDRLGVDQTVQGES